jgi:phenylacetate-CoA ligase
LIESAFGAQVYDQYGCSEMALFAAECRYGRMHISPDYGVVEIVDDSGRPVPVGKPGHVVCTGLVNDAQILLRYRLGDIASLDPTSCKCGSTFPAFLSVDGRSANAILLPDGRRLFRMAAIDAEIPRIRQYQIVQEQMDVFTLYLVTTDAFTEKDERAVRANLAASVGPARITVQRVERIAQGPGGKYASVVSKVRAAGKAAGQ